MSLVDVCKGFNLVGIARCAREVLAILLRSGQYLPVCLTLGPAIGPADFAFATDRIFASGRRRKTLFCSNWQIYADGVTIRSGRWLSGVHYTGSEKAERLREAQRRENASQPDLDKAFRALGFDPKPLGQEADAGVRAELCAGRRRRPEAKPRLKTKGEQAGDGFTKEATGFPSPYAHYSINTVCMK